MGTTSTIAPPDTITYAIVATPLGHALVAGTARGACSVRLGDDAELLAAELRAEFPDARVEEDGEGLAAWTAAIGRHVSGDPAPLDLPLDLRATVFQRRVWDALRAIPYGATRSYSDIAATIGQPTAVRAVARACATNPIALAIPCHRVLRTDGSLGGYRWGVERKRELLAREQGLSRAEPAETPRVP